MNANIIQLPSPRPVKPSSPRLIERFRIQTFTNRGGSESCRVTGSKRDGTRIRENFPDMQAAQCRRIELEAEFHAGHSDTAMRATKLSHEQVQLAEVACIKLGEDWPRLLDAVELWMKRGKQVVTESPLIDDAVQQFADWMETAECEWRERTKSNLNCRVKMFGNGIGNLKVADITVDTVLDYLEKRAVAKASKDNDRRALSRFFGWCMFKQDGRSRGWGVAANPAKKQNREKRRHGPTPSVLNVKQCQALLRASEKRGLAPYVALCLFGGIRPDGEISRLRADKVNLKDREIKLEGSQTKTLRPRVVSICDTLHAWLTAYKGQPFYPSGWRKKFDAVKLAAGLKEWPVDVMRHTAISHYFRKTGSYGQTAEQFGNSEAIIKSHYQGRVSSDDTAKFYALRPKKA